MRAIDSEALIAKIMNEMRRFNYDQKKILVLSSVIGMVDALPTIDVVERKKGEWLPCTEEVDGMRFTGHRCSVCNEWEGFAGSCNFCPKCGADMRVEKEND